MKKLKNLKSLFFEAISNIILYFGFFLSVLVSLCIYAHFKNQFYAMVIFLVLFVIVVYFSFGISKKYGLYKSLVEKN